VQAIAPATATAVVWRLGGELRVTVVVKAAFVIVPEGPMAPAQPDEIIRAEVHHASSPARSLRLTPDTAPRLPRADVILGGHACAPQGQPARWLPVRLALFRERALLDKTIYVYGDDGGAVPFERIPLVYERAYGGLGFAENPLGTGTLELASKPNLVHPERAQQVACFGPIGRAWPARRKLLAGVDRKALDAPVAEIPEGFDFAYFQAAPLDQRVEPLVGDEWLVLEGMSPTLPRLRSRLPSARAVVLVYGLPGVVGGAQLEVLADTLRVDADRLGCALVWRGDFAVPGEAALAGLTVLAGVEMEGLPIAWPAPDEALGPAAADADEPIELDADALIPLSTVTLDSPAEEPHAPEPAVPFVPGPPSAAAGRAPTLVLPAERFGDTLAISQVLSPGGSPRSMPFGPLQRPAPPAWAPPPPEVSVAPPSVVADGPPAPAAPRAAARPVRTTAQGIRLDHETPLEVGVLPWALTPARGCLAVIAKATCDLVPGERAALRAQAEPLAHDVFPDGLEERVCVYPDDLSPYKVRADVVAVGHAHAPRGAAAVMDVALLFGHEGNAFERRIRVFGDRRWQRGPSWAEISEPATFGAMPLTYARAFGGPGFEANPAGQGRVDRFRHARALPPLPNLEDPESLLRVPSQRPAPACFAPLPLSWKRRAEAPARRAPWPCFPEALDWTLYQIAPRPQQLAFLRGDEPFALVGMHRVHPVLEGSLPGVTARAFASRPQGRFDEVELRLDTVVIDADAMKLSLVWRGVLTVDDEARPDVTAVHLVLEEIGKEGLTLDAARARFRRT
jgi:hypothetical protein